MASGMPFCPETRILKKVTNCTEGNDIQVTVDYLEGAKVIFAFFQFFVFINIRRLTSVRS